MILLVAAERGGGGDGKPVFITVPWSPLISTKGPIPGSVWRAMMELDQCIRRHGGWAPFRGVSDTALFVLVMGTGIDLVSALGISIARRMLVDLGMVDGPGPRT